MLIGPGRTLLISVPVKTIPASRRSRNSYSKRARRFSTRGSAAFAILGKLSALFAESATRRELASDDETSLAGRKLRAAFRGDRGCNAEDVAALPDHLAAKHERRIDRNRLAKAQLEFGGHTEVAARARGVRHRFVEQRRDDPAVRQSAPALIRLLERDGAAHRAVGLLLEVQVQPDLRLPAARQTTIVGARRRGLEAHPTVAPAPDPVRASRSRRS